MTLSPENSVQASRNTREGALSFATDLSVLDNLDRLLDGGELSAAEYISQFVHKEIAPVALDAATEILTPETFTKSRAGNCLTKTLLTSEILSFAGITNYIIFANRHALNLAVAGTREARILDSSRPVLNEAYSPRILETPRQTVPDLRDRNLAILHADELLAHVREPKRSEVEGLSAGKEGESWLDIVDRKGHLPLNYRDRYSWNPDLYSRNHTLYGTLTAADAGRGMLVAMYNFWFLGLRNSRTAGEYLTPMTGVYPELDRRTFASGNYILNEFLSHEISAGVSATDFRAKLDIPADSATALTDDVRLRLWRPDWLRKLAIARRDSEILATARVEYEQITEATPNNLTRGKLAKANQIAKTLS
jgi:hypothetical protein